MRNVFIVLTVLSVSLSIHLNKPFMLSPNKLKDDAMNALKLRSGNPGDEVIWVYSGVIRNPLTGSEIIGVQGIEITKRLLNDNITPTNETYSKPLFGSYLSKKLFIYTNIQNETDPITSYRIRKHSPLRPVTPMKSIHQLISFGLYKNTTQPSIVVQYPGGRTVTSKNVAIKENREGIVPWAQKRNIDITCFLVSKKKKTSPINRWVSFAPSSDGSGKSQEYYSLSPPKHLFDKQHAYLKCTKYGECPAWFAPGRSCCTELTGARYSALGSIPGAKLDFFRSQCPAFFAAPLDLQYFQNDAVDLLDAYKPWYNPLTTAVQSLKNSLANYRDNS